MKVDPRCKHVYASMYLWGLEQVYGKREVRFSMRPFRELTQTDQENDFDHYMAFVDDKNIRYVIDYRDKSDIHQAAIDWCDIYGKVNYRKSVIDLLAVKRKDKIHPVGPNFGINQWSSVGLYSTFLVNRAKIGWQSGWPVGLRVFLGSYNWTRRRRRIQEYQAVQSDPGYIFHASRFYRRQSHGEETNDARARFVRVARAAPNVNFEGGLVDSGQVAAGYEDVCLMEGFTTSSYLEKTALSAVVFNTPAAWGCHGWKLGEYMALGKAILSAPFVNDLPPGIEHGKNIHIIEQLDELEDAVKLLLRDHTYRRRLEVSARAYFEEFLEPAHLMRRILALGEASLAPASRA